MSRLINNENLQHYTNKMCNADNRKVGSKSLPTALNDIDSLIDEMKTNFDAEYGTPLCMKLSNGDKTFNVGTGIDIDKREDIQNSFTDIELSGNTILNLAVTNQASKRFYKNDRRYVLGNVDANLLFKPNTKYTVIFNVDTLVLDEEDTDGITIYAELTRFNNHGNELCKVKETGRHIGVFNTGTFQEDQKNNFLTLKGNKNQWEESMSETREITLSNVVVLEGDWLDKPIPQFFKGLKSIGDEDIDNPKISIASISKNVLSDTSQYNNTNGEWARLRGDIVDGYGTNKGIEVEYSGTTSYRDVVEQRLNTGDYTIKKIFENTWYTLSFYAKGDKVTTYIYPNLIDTNTKGYINGVEHDIVSDGRVDHTLTPEWKRYSVTFKTKSVFPRWANGSFLLFRMFDHYDKCVISSIMLEQGKVATEYEEQLVDKKHISLNEPLRALPNGTKDTIEKINGSWKIVRRCAVRTITGDEAWSWSGGNGEPQETQIIALYYNDSQSKQRSTLLSNKFRQLSGTEWNEFSAEGIYRGTLGFGITVDRDRLSEVSIIGFKQWLKANNFDFIYELPEPVIEDIDPVILHCWKNGTICIDEILPLETTHTVALNKPAQIKRNIEELTELRNRVKKLEETLDCMSLDQALQFQLLNHSINLDK